MHFQRVIDKMEGFVELVLFYQKIGQNEGGVEIAKVDFFFEELFGEVGVVFIGGRFC